MIAFVTSSPFREDVDRPTFNNQNGFVDRICECLPEFPRCLYICSSPDRHDLNCQFGADVFMAFANAGVHFTSYQVLDDLNADMAQELVYNADLIVLAGGHLPTQNDFFQRIGLRELLARRYDVVMDGRDIGTVVLPDARVKIFLTASAEVRAARRLAEFRQKGDTTSTLESVLTDMMQRDARDSQRAVAPLMQAADAVLLDTSLLNIEESVAAMKEIIGKKLEQ